MGFLYGAWNASVLTVIFGAVSFGLWQLQKLNARRSPSKHENPAIQDWHNRGLVVLVDIVLATLKWAAFAAALFFMVVRAVMMLAYWFVPISY